MAVELICTISGDVRGDAHTRYREISQAFRNASDSSISRRTVPEVIDYNEGISAHPDIVSHYTLQISDQLSLSGAQALAKKMATVLKEYSIEARSNRRIVLVQNSAKIS